ncbi:MAG: hypothetical protein FWE63_01705 [Bacteroidales bacterium]|nr:hypothetical protein [Bacteroidales bacterium]
MKKIILILIALTFITSSFGQVAKNQVKAKEYKLQTTSDTEDKTGSRMKNIDELKENDLFGIPVTRWVFEGADGINQYQFEHGYPLPAQSITADYGYYFNFEYPNNAYYTYATPITFQNGDFLYTKVFRKGTFELEGDILTIHFTEVTHQIPNTFGKLGEPMQESLTITMKVETDGRTELFLKQISGENIFEENDKNKKIKFVASIKEVLR